VILRYSQRNKIRGVTLPIVMVAVIVGTILATVAILHPEKRLALIKEAQYIQNIQEYAVAISRYMWLNGRVPNSLEEIIDHQPPILRQLYPDPFTGLTTSWQLKKVESIQSVEQKMPIGSDNHTKICIVTTSKVVAGDGSLYSDWWVDEWGNLHRNLIHRGK
jgi:hypothetical protein